MVQLILDVTDTNLSLPESKRGGYSAYARPLYADTEMASGRLTRESRKSVYIVQYQYGYLTDEQKEDFMLICEKGSKGSITCGFLMPYSGDELILSDFLVTSYSYPRFMWSRMRGENFDPLWGDYRIALREVNPHD